MVVWQCEVGYCYFQDLYLFLKFFSDLDLDSDKVGNGLVVGSFDLFSFGFGFDFEEFFEGQLVKVVVVVVVVMFISLVGSSGFIIQEGVYIFFDVYYVESLVEQGILLCFNLVGSGFEVLEMVVCVLVFV